MVGAACRVPLSELSRALVGRLLRWRSSDRPSAVQAVALVEMAQQLRSAVSVNRAVSGAGAGGCSKNGSTRVELDTEAKWEAAELRASLRQKVS